LEHYQIAVIPGDGIGQDVIAEGITTLNLLGELTNSYRLEYRTFPWSCRYYLDHGSMMPGDGLKQLEGFPAIYFGACGFPALVPDHISLWGLILPIRKYFQQYVNLRPIRLLPGLRGRLYDKGEKEIDFVCVRENTEGEYAGVGGRVHVNTKDEVAIQTIAHGCGADYPLRLRAGAKDGARPGDQRHEIQRHAIQHGLLGRRLPRGGGGLPGNSHHPVPRRRHRGPLHHQS